MTGDTIRAEVYAKYLDPDPSNWTAALQNLMAPIAAGTAPMGTVIEAVPPFGSDGFPFAGLLDAAKAGDTGTRAYLNILVFDENLTFVDGAFVPVTTAAKENGTNVPHEKLSQEIVVQQPGYAYIYFSNDNGQPLEVFFDDFTVEHVHSAIIQADDYYPFGMTFNSYKRENGVENKFLYNGKEMQEETGWYDYGFRMYDPVISRFHAIDPIADNYAFQTPYAYAANNPIKYIDFLGLGPTSTHTDSTGVVLAVYDDGDLGVYRHKGKGAEAERSIKQNYSKNNTSAGGERMEESLHSLSFADQNLYNKTGKVKKADIKIDYGSTELTDKVQEIIDANPSLVEYAAKAGSNGDWDLKSNTLNGSLLYGKYASPRDGGNFTAGAVAQMSGLEPVAQFGYGAYNMTGNSKWLTGLVTGVVGLTTLINPPVGLGAAYLIGKYGEDKLTQRSIGLGKQFIKRK